MENVNLLEKNSLLHTEVRQIREDMAQIEHTATESLRIGTNSNPVRKTLKYTT